MTRGADFTVHLETAAEADPLLTDYTPFLAGLYTLTLRDRKSCTTWYAPTDTRWHGDCQHQHHIPTGLLSSAFLPLFGGRHGKGLLAIEMVVPGDGADADGGGRGRCEGEVEGGSVGGLRAGSRGSGSLRYMLAAISQLGPIDPPMASITHRMAGTCRTVVVWRKALRASACDGRKRDLASMIAEAERNPPGEERSATQRERRAGGGGGERPAVVVP